MADHASLTGAELHEPKGVSTAAAGQVYIADGSGSGIWNVVSFDSVPSGSVIGHSIATTGTISSGVANIPLDDSIPQNTEGLEVLTITYTPKRADSVLVIEAQSFGVSSAQVPLALALFKDSGASAIAATASPNSYASGEYLNAPYLVYTETSGSTSSRVYKIRVGAHTNSAANTFIHQNTSGRLFGGVLKSFIRITEYRA